MTSQRMKETMKANKKFIIERPCFLSTFLKKYKKLILQFNLLSTSKIPANILVSSFSALGNFARCLSFKLNLKIRGIKEKVVFCLGVQKTVYSQTWANDHLRIATTCQQRPLFWGPIFNYYNIMLPLNHDQLSTTATFWGSRGWSLYTGLTVYCMFNLTSKWFWLVISDECETLY